MKYSLWLSTAVLIVAIGCKKDNKTTVPTLTTATVSSISPNSASTGGTITGNGGSTITKSGICWATHSNPGLGDSITTDGSVSGPFTSQLNNLNANTTYYVRAYAINNSGTGYGNVESFSTLKGLATITTMAVTNIVPLMANTGGNISNDGGSPVTVRGLVWSTSIHPTLANFKTADGNGTGSFSDTLTNLASQTVYYVRAYATNSAGTAYGNQVSFSAAPASTVTDFDGNVYPYVILGTQSWMATNLKTTHFQNGDPIPNGLVNYSWTTDTLGAYTFPNGDTTTKSRYGILYDAYVVNDVRNACPMGWHIPTDGEWQTLEFFEGMTPTDTLPNNLNDRGTIAPKLVVGGSSGLNLTYAGILFPGDGNYYNFGNQGYYQSSTAFYTLYNNTGFYLGNYYRLVDSANPAPVNRNYIDVAGSIRCIKN